MKWKQIHTVVALTCALVITVMFMTAPAAASTSTKDATQTMAVFDKTTGSRDVLAKAPGTGGIADEMTIAQKIDKAGDVVLVEKKLLMDELYVVKIRQPLTLTEVAITAFATKEPFLTAKAFEYSDEIKLARIITVEPWAQVVLRC